MQIDLERLDEQHTPNLLALNSDPQKIVFVHQQLAYNDVDKILIPIALQKHIESGTEIINVPFVPQSQNREGLRVRILYCLLEIRETKTLFIVKIPASTQVGFLAKFLVERLLPYIPDIYEWTIEHNRKDLPPSFTLQIAGIRTGDKLRLVGKRRLFRKIFGFIKNFRDELEKYPCKDAFF